MDFVWTEAFGQDKLAEEFVGSNQAATTKSKPCEMHLTTAVGTCLVTRRVVGGIRGSGLTNICGWPVGFAKRGFDGMHRS